MTYYEINENAARRAKEMNSFSDYREGEATQEYRRMVDKAVQIAERQKSRVDSMYHEKIDRLLDTYARKLADNLNHRYEIDARVPSVMIAGPANFPVRKKEKQNAARDTNDAEYREIQEILSRIQSCGMGGIMSDDENALAKLRAKLKALEGLQEHMKAANAYYRKHGTLDGCPEASDEVRRQMEADHLTAPKNQPYPGWALSNNNANIHRVRDRIAALEKEAARAAEQADAAPEQGDGYILKENFELCRIQFIFDGKPDDDTRALLKSYGFRWSPSQGAWQRMLNDNGRYAAERIKERLAANG
jgi:hypothetical protein